MLLEKHAVVDNDGDGDDDNDCDNDHDDDIGAYGYFVIGTIIGQTQPSHGQGRTKMRHLMWQSYQYVPHKAVMEVSKIANCRRGSLP